MPAGLEMLPTGLDAVPVSLAAQWTWGSDLARLQAVVAAGLLLLALAWLPALVRLAWIALRGLGPLERRAVAISLGLGVGLRLAVDDRLVMIFSAWRMAEDVAAATGIPKYGAGTFVLHRLAFALAPPDHAVLVSWHRACAILALPLWLAVLARTRPLPGTVGWAAALLATMPLLVRDAATESNLVPAALGLAATLLLLDAALDRGRPARGFLVGATVVGAWTAMTRPELPVVVALLAVAWPYVRRARLPWPSALLAGLAWSLLVAPHLLHVALSAAEEATTGALPPLGFARIPAAVQAIPQFAPLQPLLVPVAVPVLAALAGSRPNARLAGVLLAVALLWMGLTSVDLPAPSVPRLHAPPVLLVTLVAAAGAAWLVQRTPRKLLATCWLAACLALAALPTVPHLFARSNEDDAEVFLRRAFAALPPVGACLVYLGFQDPPVPHRTQRALPAYLLRPPHRDVTVYDLGTWARRGHPICRNGTYWLQDHRCWAVDRYHRRDAGTRLLSGCQAIRQAHPWRPVLEERAPNRGDNAYGYWGNGQHFDLGLWRLP